MMVMATILIVLFHLALTRKKSHIWFRTDFLSIMLAVIFLRILFPIELPFTITLICPGMPPAALIIWSTVGKRSSSVRA